jgi:hypothetical protein
MCDFDGTIKILRRTLKEKNPQTFSSSWIHTNLPSVYWYIQCNIRTKNGKIDWERVTSTFNRSLTRRWTRYGCRNIRIYERRSEVDIALTKYEGKLPLLLSAITKADRKVQNKILVSLIRIGQRGNITAQDEVIKWVTFTTNEWIDSYPLNKWQPYPDEVSDKIFRCIRNYRYCVPFLGYLFKTLECAGRGKPPLVSLDDKFTDTTKTRIDYLVLNENDKDYSQNSIEDFVF